MADRLTIRSLSLRYSESLPDVLSTVSVEIKEGTCCAIVGPTGAGKSSLLQSIAGTMKRHHPECVSSGTIRIATETFEALPPGVLFPQVGLVLQDPHVQISGVRDSVLAEVLLTLENTGTSTEHATAAAMPLLKNLGIDHLAGRKPTTLSGGETQRVALAAILVAQPSILLLDEPTTALDLAAQAKLKSILAKMKKTTTVILTDTQLDFALGLCDQIILLDRGKVVFDGVPAQFLSQLEQFRDVVVLEDWIPLKQKLLQLMEGNSPQSNRLARALGLR
jgi:energy-coupling factor transport system ATP-binding protein